MDAIKKRARELLARCLGEWGHPCEAENIREGEDLESYESELRLISQLLCFGMDTADGHGRVALTPPEGYVLVPLDLSTLQRYDIGTVHFYGDEKEDIVECAWGPYVCLSDVHALLAARPEVP